MNEIVPGIHEWKWWSEEKQLYFNGHAFVREGKLIVVDPPPFGPGEHEALVALGRPAEILITNQHHGRASRDMRREFGARIWIHEADAAGLAEPPDVTFGEEQPLPGAVRAVRVPDNKTPGECALWVPAGSTGVLILGDALIGRPKGALSLLPDDKYQNARRARAGVRVLLELPYDALLVGDGESIPAGGRAALERFLSASE